MYAFLDEAQGNEPSFDNKDFPKVRRAARKQGWTIQPTKSGEMFLAPNGIDAATWHAAHASSDPHALDRLVKRLKDSGFRWPVPKGAR